MHQDLILSDPFDQLLRDIGLVHDLADHLFQEVLERDQTHHPAELVHHDGHVSLFLLELLQELIGLFRGRHEERRMRDLLEPDIIMPLSQVHQRLGLVENPDDVVQAPVEQRDAGKLRLEELLLRLLQAQVTVEREHIEARRHRVFGRDLMQLEHVLDHPDFSGLDGPGLTPDIQHDLEFFLGHIRGREALASGMPVD